jgi:hypothetical protein
VCGEWCVVQCACDVCVCVVCLMRWWGHHAYQAVGACLVGRYAVRDGAVGEGAVEEAELDEGAEDQPDQAEGPSGREKRCAFLKHGTDAGAHHLRVGTHHTRARHARK